MRLIAAVFLVMIFAGCTATGQSERPPGPMPATTRPVYNLTGYSPALRMAISMAARPRRKRVSGSRTRAGFLLILNTGWDGTTALAFAGASSRAECPRNCPQSVPW